MHLFTHVDVQFTCPECGTHSFGSNSTGPFIRRICHGWIKNRRCNFTFSIKDDYKYFAFRMNSQESYQKLYDLVFNETRTGKSSS